MPASNAFIETRQLSMSYPLAHTQVNVLREVNIRIEAGTRVAIAGPSGSGKTSLLLLLSGLERPSSGQVLWEEEALNARQRRWLCGLVFQFPERHFLGLSVGQELKLGQRRLTAEHTMFTVAGGAVR